MNKIRPVFLRETRMLPLRMILLIAVLVVAALTGSFMGSFFPNQDSKTEGAATTVGAAALYDDGQQVSEHRSVDGKTVCYSAIRGGHTAISCLPTWLLDQPRNWVVMYPQPKPPAKKKEGRRDAE